MGKTKNITSYSVHWDFKAKSGAISIDCKEESNIIQSLPADTLVALLEILRNHKELFFNFDNELLFSGSVPIGQNAPTVEPSPSSLKPTLTPVKVPKVLTKK